MMVLQLASATYSVSGEAISATFEMEPAWEGKLIYASVAAAPSLGKQPSAVTEAYGRYFQNIEGDCVIWNKSENIFLAQAAKFNCKIETPKHVALEFFITIFLKKEKKC